MFQYGALRGDRVFVQELAKFLTDKYQETVDRYTLYRSHQQIYHLPHPFPYHTSHHIV